MSFSDAEYRDPEDSNANGGDTDDAGCEEQHCDEQEDDIINWEDLGSLDQNPVDRVEDVDVTKKMTAMFFADGVLGLVNTGDEHADPDQKYNKDQKKSKYKLDRPEYSSKLEPDLVEEVLILPGALLGKALMTT